MTNERARANDPAYDMPKAPICRLLIAIGILQALALASDTENAGPSTWGSWHMPEPALDHAIGILINLVRDVERLS